MKADEIDKKIGMPDVDAEWTIFANEVVENRADKLMLNPKKKVMIKKIAAAALIVLSFSGAVLATVNHREMDDDKELKIDTCTETKPLVIYREGGFRDGKPRYLVNLCSGTYIKNHEGKEYLEEEYLNYGFCEQGFTLTMMLDGKPFDKNSLPKLTNKDLKCIESILKDGNMKVNLITKNMKVPISVTGNLPREMTILLPGKGEIDITMNKAQEGNWMNCSCTSWEKTSWGWSVEKEFERVKKVPGFKAYIYSSTEASQKDIDRATAMLKRVGITNISYKKNIPIKHFTNAELRQRAQKEKAKGTKYADLYNKMAPQGMAVADVRSQWHIVKSVYGIKK